jgi:hypothetical protein
MTFLRNLRDLRDLIAEAAHEAFLLADFLIRRADDRWIMKP